jgi:hypothetical protein
MKIDQYPFPTNTVEVSSKDMSRVKLLTSISAQNKGTVDPKVQVPTIDVILMGCLLSFHRLASIQALMDDCMNLVLEAYESMVRFSSA